MKDSPGETCTYVVDGILKKHQKFIYGEIATGGAAGNTAAFVIIQKFALAKKNIFAMICIEYK